jgi:hypothetical protein
LLALIFLSNKESLPYRKSKKHKETIIVASPPLLPSFAACSGPIKDVIPLYESHYLKPDYPLL